MKRLSPGQYHSYILCNLVHLVNLRFRQQRVVPSPSPWNGRRGKFAKWGGLHYNSVMPNIALAADIPTEPGCYLFSDKNGQVIYVGKARNLKKRVNSYFQKKKLDPRTGQLVKQVTGMDFIITDNEVEALILENTLIKKYSPRYNINLKDSKNYAYIQVTADDFPRLLVVRKKTGDGEFYGPFVSGATRDDIVAVLKRSFQLRTCKKMPSKPCLRYQLNLCPAPCTGKIGVGEYADRIKRVRLVLKGKIKELIDTLEAEMKAASDRLNFEYALELRRQVEAVKSLQERQNVDRQKRYPEDVVHFAVKGQKVFLMVFNVLRGILENKQEYEFDYLEGFFQEFLARFYSENPVPREIIVPEPVDEALVDFLKRTAGHAVQVTVPQKGEKKQLLELVRKNIESAFFGQESILEDLQGKLALPDVPQVIECFDISHLSGTATVASMVQFRAARPDKGNYRRFQIKSVAGIDDVKAIGEVVRRRYARLLKEGAPLPDLVVIDGGPGQLNAALRELETLGIAIPVIAIAKQFEEIYRPGYRQPLRLSQKSRALLSIRRVRDEAHRFALAYNRLRRKKDLFAGTGAAG